MYSIYITDRQARGVLCVSSRVFSGSLGGWVVVLLCGSVRNYDECILVLYVYVYIRILSSLLLLVLCFLCLCVDVVVVVSEKRRRRK